MRRGSECPVKMTIAVRGGRLACSALRCAFNDVRIGASSAADGGGSIVLGGGTAGWSAGALGVTPRRRSA